MEIATHIVTRRVRNSCKVIQEVWVFQLAPGYGPALQRSALLCACWSMQFVGCWSEERNAWYSTRKSIMKRGGPRKERIKKRKRTSRLWKMGEQILLISFSQTSYSKQPLFSDSAFWLIGRGGYQSLQLPLSLVHMEKCWAFFEAVNAGFMVYEEEPSTLWKSVSDSFSLPFVPPF